MPICPRFDFETEVAAQHVHHAVLPAVRDSPIEVFGGATIVTLHTLRLQHKSSV